MDTQPKARVAMTPPKVHIQSLGCIESAQDAFRLREYFIGNGWIESAGIEDADLVVINTCGVNEKRERDSCLRNHDFFNSLLGKTGKRR